MSPTSTEGLPVRDRVRVADVDLVHVPLQPRQRVAEHGVRPARWSGSWSRLSVSAETAPPSTAVAKRVVATAPSTSVTWRILAAKSALDDRATTTLIAA